MLLLGARAGLISSFEQNKHYKLLARRVKLIMALALLGNT